MIRWVTILIGLVVMLSSCGRNKDQGISKKEDLTAKKMLQGIWLDDETEMPLMRINGDTIYYTDSHNAPVYFRIIGDTLYCNDNSLATYKIDRQTEDSFWFHTLTDEVVKLHKSDNPDDVLTFANREDEITPITSEVIKKDSVVMYNGTRYRGYVYVNPSKMKVIKSSYSEEGISMDNIYYDNVIHICVYEGKKMLYGQDITKQMFSEVLPADLLTQAILSDMNFTGVNNRGYHYQAILTIPESSVSNLVNLTVDFNNKLGIKKAE